MKYAAAFQEGVDYRRAEIQAARRKENQRAYALGRAKERAGEMGAAIERVKQIEELCGNIINYTPYDEDDHVKAILRIGIGSRPRYAITFTENNIEIYECDIHGEKLPEGTEGVYEAYHQTVEDALGSIATVLGRYFDDDKYKIVIPAALEGIEPPQNEAEQPTP